MSLAIESREVEAACCFMLKAGMLDEIRPALASI